MAKTALIVGGSGQIGYVAAKILTAAGWSVRCGQRTPTALAPELIALGVEAIGLDRSTPGAIADAVGSGVDVLIDAVAYDETHARQLLEVQSAVGVIVVISSASVYCDGQGRTLDEARSNGFPRFPVPIPEDHPTVAPGPQTYSTRKVALEQALLQGATAPVTILRPCAIYGPASHSLREWWFVKRILDGRRRIPIAYGGKSRFHTSATVNIAALILTVLGKPATQVLNAADPQSLTVMEMGDAIAATYGHEFRVIPFAGPGIGGVGDNPWACPAR
ncbi:MAG TPA: NAD-dependent epimerase/dehydratase family protein [Caulobacteraceae bacterium]